jgi:hypothetical protein
MPEDQIKTEPTMQVAVIEERRTLVTQTVAAPEQISPCCQEFANEYGLRFTVLPGGGVAPASLRLVKVKLGKEVLQKPRLAWRFTPCCGRKIEAVVKPVEQAH